MNKVIGGTPKGFHTLCGTCRLAHVIRGLNLQEVFFCCAYGHQRRLDFPVETCTLYDDKRIPSLYQMEQIAWEIKCRNRGPMGFANDNVREITIEPPSRQPNQPTPPITGEVEVKP